MKKVIVFGDLPLATMVIDFLRNQSGITIAGVVTKKRDKPSVDPFDCLPLYEYCIENNIPIFKLSELTNVFQQKELDLGFSVRFSRIINDKVIKLFKGGLINFHGGLLPEYGGLYSSCHTILNDSQIAGGTLHYILNESVDTGPIIKRCEFETSSTDTSEIIFTKTQILLFEGFKDIFEFILNPQNSIRKETEDSSFGDRNYYGKTSLKKELILDDTLKTIISRHARAFEFSGHERGYIVVSGIKIYFTTKNLEGIL